VRSLEINLKYLSHDWHVQPVVKDPIAFSALGGALGEQRSSFTLDRLSSKPWGNIACEVILHELNRSVHMASKEPGRPNRLVEECFARRFLFLAERAILLTFSRLQRMIARRQKVFVQIKDRLRYSALPLNPARKLCSRFARGRAFCNFSRLSEPFRFCQPDRHFKLDFLSLSELLARGKLVDCSVNLSPAVRLRRLYQSSLRFATRTRWLQSRSCRGRSSTHSVLPNFVALCNRPPAVIAATLPSLVGL
jgi:hypothetical protein